MHLKSKSEFNISAAEVLISEYDNYAPSVHCSYYGCFQYIKHKLNQLGHTYEEVDKVIQESKTKPIKESTHGYPIELIKNLLNAKYNDGGILARDVQNKIKLLKAYRTLSDYKNEQVDFKKGTEALKISKDILTIIKTKL